MRICDATKDEAHSRDRTLFLHIYTPALEAPALLVHGSPLKPADPFIREDHQAFMSRREHLTPSSRAPSIALVRSA